MRGHRIGELGGWVGRWVSWVGEIDAEKIKLAYVCILF